MTNTKKFTEKKDMERQIKINNWRIVKIDELLQSGRWYTAKEIEKSIEDGSYSLRAIQRDIEYMRDTLNAPLKVIVEVIITLKRIFL